MKTSVKTIAAVCALACALAVAPAAWADEASGVLGGIADELAAVGVGASESSEASDDARADDSGALPADGDVAVAPDDEVTGEETDPVAEPVAPAVPDAATAPVEPASAPVPAAEPVAEAPVDLQVDPVEDLGLSGFYEVRSGLGAFALDVAGGSKANGGNVQIWSTNGMLPQLFRFVYEDGWYYIVNANSGLALDVLYGSNKPGTNVQQYRLMKGNANQQFAITKNANGTYTFTNRASGLVLDVSGGRAAAGTNVQMWTANGQTPQTWRLNKRVNLLSEGIYNIVPSYTGRPLDVAGSGTAENTNVALWSNNGALAQKWAVKRVAENTYTLQSLCSGLYLAANAGGTNAVTRSASAGDAIRWQPDILNGAYVLRNVATGTVLDVSRGIDKDGANVSLYKRIDSDPQRFLFKSTAPIANGVYQIEIFSNRDVVVDLRDASSKDGTNIQFWRNLQNGAQKWTFTRNSDGSYHIVNAANFKALDLADGKAAAGTNVRLWPSNEYAAQKWFITYDSGFKLQSAVNRSFVLELGGAIKPGANLQLGASKDTANQRFWLQKTTPPMSETQAYMYNRAQSLSSATDWLIVVDTEDPYLGVFHGSKGNWEFVHFWQASCGKASTPTVKGFYTVTGKGLSFGHGYTCWYYTQFYGDYLIHSLIYQEGSMTRELEGANTLGVNRSQGCVRVLIDQAKWIYDTIPYDTTVYIY